jgi:hypothetical protein
LRSAAVMSRGQRGGERRAGMVEVVVTGSAEPGMYCGILN